MTVIINFYGAPGAGKSTNAARVYACLKMLGLNAELVREYAKDWAWDNREVSQYDQLYFFGKQVRKESMLYEKVDWIVTDSPVMISLFYAQKYLPKRLVHGMTEMVNSFYEQAEADGHNHHHILLTRAKAYNPAGRYQTEEQSDLIQTEMKTMLNELKVTHSECPGLATHVDQIVSQIIDLENKKTADNHVSCLSLQTKFLTESEES